MRQTTVNEFKDGLNLDLHPIVTPKTVLTDNINGTFITYNGNEFCLQNDRGNKKVASITDGYTPIGIKEYNGILYIVSVNDENLTEIGTYPSPAYPDTWTDNCFENTYDLEESYKPLMVLEGRSPFTNVPFKYDVNHPVTIEIQDSYDGSVNLILVADECKTRIINSGFSVLPNNKCKFLSRRQSVETNVYDEDVVKDTELIRVNDVITNIDLYSIEPVKAGGQLKGGNYTFYIKFGDADYNQTDVVAESGIVSIFNGTDGKPSTISGTLLDERTDKMVGLTITGLNHVYSKIYIYYSREYSDTLGYRMTEYGMFNEPIDMVDDKSINRQDIWITGFEQMVPINPEELNVDYHTVDWARAEAQNSNMLFLGNIGWNETFKLYKTLEDFTLNHVNYQILQGELKDNSGGDNFSNGNYYSTKNIYYTLGYWPNEYYRFGIVYILKDGSTTPVFNMHGNIDNNDKGVFKTQNLNVLQNQQPIYFKFTLNTETLNEDNVIGWFVVRQKRIPTTICQALGIGTDKRSYLPMVWDDNNGAYNWYIESFLSLNRSVNVGEEKNSNKHILRPFLETFEQNSKIIAGLNTTNVDYIIVATYYIPGKIYTGSGASTIVNGEIQNWYNSNISTILNGIGYSSTDDLFIEDKNLADIWNDVETHNLIIWTVPYSQIRNIDGSFSGKNRFFYATTNSDLSYGNAYKGTPSGFYLTSMYRSEEIAEIFSGQIYSKFDYRFIKENNSDVNSNALLSLDPCVNNSVASMFDGSGFQLHEDYRVTCNRNNLVFDYDISSNINSTVSGLVKTVFVQENTKSKVLDDNNAFSNVAGSGSTAGDFEYTKRPFGVHFNMNPDLGPKKTYIKSEDVIDEYGVKDFKGYNSTHNVNLIRGAFTPYLGLDRNVSCNTLYSIRMKEGDALTIRSQDNSEYYCVSERVPIETLSTNVYRGDCYICKVGMRILHNFIDNTAPVTTTIVDPLSWERFVRQKSLYGGDGNGEDAEVDIVDYSEVNLSDLNAVDLGYWVTFPCLSSYNLGLRSLDTSHVDEMALLGSPRSFYPLSGASALSKVGDSYLLNDGLSATVGRKRYNIMPDVPYSKSEFANRIMFSNVHITDAFTNGYRTFQGLSYKDYDKQYGAITKLISLGQNIFIVMEHGLGLVPVNPKALMQTTTGEAIHIYGHGVLPDEMTVISQDYGSKYEHSVIRTPIGIYGIDVDAKKVWRFSDKQGFETISDMKVETYLKDYLEPLEINIGAKDIRTHYNANKGDLMFTWYNGNKLCSICFNERQNLWTTRYDWCPIVSENINDNFHSINKDLNSDSDYIIWEHSDDVGTDGTHVSNWYNGEQGFEFEFVVSDPIGVNKIFDNLQIISNNVQPQEMEITVIGDDYEFKRDLANVVEPRLSNLGEDPNNITTTSNIHGEKSNPKLSAVYKFDKRLNQSAITKWQPFKDIYKFGRRIGNIQYKEGSWYTQIEPLLINDERLVAKEARIRDKWARIRIRYSGKDLAVITAIKTLINI